MTSKRRIYSIIIDVLLVRVKRGSDSSMEKIMPEFSVRVKALRKEKRYKQKEMADLLGCTDRNYQKLEYGLTNVPSLTLIKLADFFDVSTDYLLGRDDRRKP